MRTFLRALGGAYLRLTKSKGNLEITARGPIAVVGVIGVVILVVLFGDNFIALIWSKS